MPGADELGTHLELIAELGREFASTLDVDSTLGTAVKRITAWVGAEEGAVSLVDEETGELVCRACTGPTEITGLRLEQGQGIVGRSVRENRCEFVRDVSTDPNFEAGVDATTGFKTRSILCAPLSVQGRCLGAIELLNKRGGEGLFDEEDKHLLQSMASSAALALLNTRFATELMERERTQRELELAAEIQRSLLPKRELPPFPVAGASAPARVVSGDFFDFLRAGEGRIHFAVGDVSGKGINAALLGAKTSGLYRFLARGGHEPEVILRRLNAEICETSTRGMFVTMVAACYETSTGRIRLANAGHEPPLLQRQDGSFVALPAQAVPLGIVPDTKFATHELKLDHGALYVFTDGFTEAHGPDGNQLGRRGLEQLVRRYADLPLGGRLDALVAHVSREPLRDDATVLGVDG